MIFCYDSMNMSRSGSSCYVSSSWNISEVKYIDANKLHDKWFEILMVTECNIADTSEMDQNNDTYGEKCGGCSISNAICNVSIDVAHTKSGNVDINPTSN